MKRLFILPLAFVCLGGYQETYAEIRNGYDEEVNKNEKYIRNLNEIAKEVLNVVQLEKLKKCLEAAHSKAEKMQKKQAKTQELIERFRMIAPDLYHEINNIKDREGNVTDVYIKVADTLGTHLIGATNLKQSVDNPNVHSSEYGEYTVSVRVIYRYPRQALKVLFHELGHVRYQVSHLASYCEFYKKVYQDPYFEGIEIGHHPHDPSHRSVKETLNVFKISWREHNRETKRMAKNKSEKILASTKSN